VVVLHDYLRRRRGINSAKRDQLLDTGNASAGGLVEVELEETPPRGMIAAFWHPEDYDDVDAR